MGDQRCDGPSGQRVDTKTKGERETRAERPRKAEPSQRGLPDYSRLGRSFPDRKRPVVAWQVYQPFRQSGVGSANKANEARGRRRATNNKRLSAGGERRAVDGARMGSDEGRKFNSREQIGERGVTRELAAQQPHVVRCGVVKREKETESERGTQR